MSAYSTLRISRTKAKALVYEKLLALDDDQLEDFVDSILEPRLYNCKIVADSQQNDDETI